MINFIIIFSFLSLGIIAKRFITEQQAATDHLNKLVINIIIPAVILLNAPDLLADKSLLPLIYSPWVILLFSALMILSLAKVFAWNRSTTAALLLMGTLGNTSFLGFPMIEALLNRDALQYAVVYDQIGNFLALAIFGTSIIAIYGEGKSSPNIKDIGLRIIRFPPFIFLVLTISLKAMALDPKDFSLLAEVVTPITYLLTPVTMFIIGLNFSINIAEHQKSAFICGLVIKLIAAPFMMYLWARNLTENTLMLQTLTLEAGMPPMVTAAALAMSANLERKLCASMVAIGLLTALVSLPIIYLIIR